jgi:peroxiredoxin
MTLGPALLSAMVAVAPVAAGGGDPAFDDDTSDVVGRPAPPWELEQWINSKPLTLASLRGKVVLVRWFMSPECPFCTATAPSLNQLHREYAARGLVVVGAYHHKRAEPLGPGEVAGYAAQYGFQFPVAVDPEWRTLRNWWLRPAHSRRWTSVSFLIDRRGVVRHVHTGGKYAPGDPELATMRAWIDRLVSER